MKHPLPPLPKQNKKPEADFGLDFRRWWEKKRLPGEFELKDSRGEKSIAFSEFHHDQEVVANLAVSRKGILLRREYGTVGAADYSGLVETPYWIVIRYPGSFHIISYGTFLLERSRSKRKSLTSERASEISVISVKLSTGTR